jgi:hypothetical protein
MVGDISKHMVSKIIHILIGIVVFSAGIKVYVTGWDHVYGFPIPPKTAILICLLGLAIVISSLLKGKKINDKIDRH